MDRLIEANDTQQKPSQQFLPSPVGDVKRIHVSRQRQSE